MKNRFIQLSAENVRDQLGMNSLHTLKERVFEFLSNNWVMASLTVLPTTLLYVFITLAPIMWAILAGFHTISIYTPEWAWNGVQNHIKHTTSSGFWQSVLRSIEFAGLSVVFQLFVGTAIALVVNRKFRFNGMARTIVILPYLIPTVIIGYISVWMLNSQWGIINVLLVRTGLIGSNIPWFSTYDTAMYSVVAVNNWKFTIFVTIMVLARLQGIPESFYEAATMSGAGTWRKFRDITLPNLKGVIFIVLLLRGVWQFNRFDLIWVLTGGGPYERTLTTSIYAYKVGFQTGNLGESAAIATLLFIMLVFTAILYFVTLKPAEEVRVE